MSDEQQQEQPEGTLPADSQPSYGYGYATESLKRPHDDDPSDVDSQVKRAPPATISDDADLSQRFQFALPSSSSDEDLDRPPSLTECWIIRDFPDHVAGRFYGRGGAQISRLQETTGAKIDIDRLCRPGKSARRMLIRGPGLNVLECWKETSHFVLSALNSEGKETISRTHSFPSGIIGMIIGHKGATISKIQDYSDASIKASRESLPGSDLREITISGRPTAVTEGERLVYARSTGIELADVSMIDNFRVTDLMCYIPEYVAMGDLLGNQQELLFKLQDTTEATITISKIPHKSDRSFRKVTIRGMTSQVAAAYAHIQNIVHGVAQGPRAPIESFREPMREAYHQPAPKAEYTMSLASLQGMGGMPQATPSMGPNFVYLGATPAQVQTIVTPQGVFGIIPAGGPPPQMAYQPALDRDFGAYGGGYALPSTYDARTLGYGQPPAGYDTDSMLAAMRSRGQEQQQQRQPQPTQSYPSHDRAPAPQQSSERVMAPNDILDAVCIPDDRGDYKCTLVLSRDNCGRLIGKGGLTIRSVEENSRARVKVEGSSRDPSRPVNLFGSQEHIQRAKELIYDALIGKPQ